MRSSSILFCKRKHSMQQAKRKVEKKGLHKIINKIINVSSGVSLHLKKRTLNTSISRIFSNGSRITCCVHTLKNAYFVKRKLTFLKCMYARLVLSNCRKDDIVAQFHYAKSGDGHSILS